MSVTTVQLQRSDPKQPWGFRIHGGADFNQPLVIIKVTAGSLSAQQGLLPGDQIIKVNGQDSLRLRHTEAQQLILGCGNQVAFEVVRGDNANLQRVLHSEGIQSLKQSSSSTTISSSSRSNVLATMVQTTSAVSTAAVTPWAGPRYTEESIKETLTSQASVLETGAIGVNFIKKKNDELDIKKSEVLKMLNEIEQERKERARSPSVPPQLTGNSTFGILMSRNYEASVLAQQPQAPWATQLSPSIRQPPPPPQPQQEAETATPVPVEGS